MKKQIWMAVVGAGALAIVGCGQTSDDQQEAALPIKSGAKSLTVASDNTNEVTKKSLSAESWIGKPGNEPLNGLTIAEAKDVVKAIDELEDGESALESLKYQIPKSSFSPVVYKDRFSTIHAMGCRGASCGSLGSISWIMEYLYDEANKISEIYICTDDGIEIKIWSSYGNDVFEDGNFESAKPDECYEDMFFKGS